MEKIQVPKPDSEQPPPPSHLQQQQAYSKTVSEPAVGGDHHVKNNPPGYCYSSTVLPPAQQQHQVYPAHGGAGVGGRGVGGGEIFRDLDHGDNEVNAAAKKHQQQQLQQQPTGYPPHNQQRPKQTTEAEEGSHIAHLGGKALQFTPEMVRDQEMLVTTLTQQGISEGIIRRQFDRLLEEQSKQLLLRHPHHESKSHDNKKAESMAEAKRKKSEPTVRTSSVHYVPAVNPANQQPNIPCCPSEKCNANLNYVSPAQITQHQHPHQYQNQNQYSVSQQQQQQQYLQQQQQYQPQQQYVPQQYLQQHQQYQQQQEYMQQCQQLQQQQQQQQQQQHQQHPVESKSPNVPRIEPVSLLKLRMQKEKTVIHGRNNGLQDFETAKEIVQKTYKTKKPAPYEQQVEYSCRLDGTQDRGDMEPIMQQLQPSRNAMDNKKKVLANGLEKDPSIQLAPRRSFARHNVEETAVVYPRQRGYPHFVHPEPQHHNVEVSRPYGDNNQTHPGNQQQQSHGHHEIPQNSQMHPQYQYQQQQQYFQQQQQHLQQQQQLQQQYEQQQQQLQQQQPPTTDAAQNQNYQNYFKFCPDIQEPKVIGGVTYLARKPQCMQSVSNFSNVDHTKSATAF